jgi:hypothetical protein
VNDHIWLAVDQPCMVLVRANEKSVEQIAVSDPTHKLTALQLKVSGMIEGSGDVWEATYNKKEKESVVDIALPSEGFAGQTVVLNLSKL